MPDLLTPPERKQLERLEGTIEEWQEALLNDLEATVAVESGEVTAPVDPALMERFKETAQRLSSRVHKEVPPDIDPEALAEIRGHIIEGLEALIDLDEDRPLNSIDSFIVHAEAVRHIVRDALDGQPLGDESDARELLEGLLRQLPGISRKELAALIGLSERQVQRILKSGHRAPSRRLQLIARLVVLLGRAWTSAGALAWFYRSRDELDGQAPVDVLDDPDYERALLLAARRGRAQHGS